MILKINKKQINVNKWNKNRITKLKNLLKNHFFVKILDRIFSILSSDKYSES